MTPLTFQETRDDGTRMPFAERIKVAEDFGVHFIRLQTARAHQEAEKKADLAREKAEKIAKKMAEEQTAKMLARFTDMMREGRPNGRKRLNIGERKKQTE